jgi:short-subunit dehydrogenase
MSARDVAVIGHKGFRAGKALVIAGPRNRFLAFAVRFAPRSLVRKIAGRLNRASYAS